MNRKLFAVAVALGVVIVLLTGLLVFLMLRARKHVKAPPVPTAVPASTAAPASASPAAVPAETDAPDLRYRAGDLDGTWTDIEYPDSELRFRETELTYQNIFGDSGKCGFTVTKELFGIAEGAMRIEFSEFGCPFEYLVWHREEIDGRSVGVLSGIIMEYDGRGPVVFNEFLRSDCGVAIPDGWRSAVAHAYNDREPTPSYMSE